MNFSLYGGVVKTTGYILVTFLPAWRVVICVGKCQSLPPKEDYIMVFILQEFELQG